jgi:beta-lactamase class A
MVDTRRRLMIAMPLWAGIASCAPPIAAVDTVKGDAQNAALAKIEKRIGGRVGAALLATSGQLLAGHRAQERFAMCSTFKAPLAAALMAAHERGALNQFAKITVTQKDLVPYAPFVERIIREQRATSLYELAEKAVDYSDNAAANLILRALGGPQALTAFFQSHGGAETRLDRFEPEMNENAIGDPRDTTTPLSMANMMRHLLVKHSAGVNTANILRQWMVNSATGKTRIEAGIPDNWTMGDKTGTAPPSAPAYNDVAIIWPRLEGGAQGKPLLLSVYLDRPRLDGDAADNAIAEIARMLVPLMASR